MQLILEMGNEVEMEQSVVRCETVKETGKIRKKTNEMKTGKEDVQNHGGRESDDIWFNKTAMEKGK